MATGPERYEQRWRRVWLWLLAASALTAMVGCSAEEPIDYSVENRNDFLEACTAPLEDGLLHVKLCECTFERLQETVAYPRFVEIEDLLAAKPLSPLPDEVAQVLADCIVDQVDL